MNKTTIPVVRRRLFPLAVFACAAILTWLSVASAQSVKRAQPAIDWAAAKTQMEASAYAERAKGRGPGAGDVKGVKLPVLLIDIGDVKAAPELRHQTDSYTAHYKLKDATLALTGLAKPIDSGGAAPAVPLPEYRFEISEDSSDLTFSRYGAFYNMRISCAKPTDPRCTESAFLTGIAKKLPVVGGEKL